MLDMAIVIFFLGLSLYIGYASSKKVKNLSHFSVGNRSFSSLMIFCTLSASFVGGGYTLGNVAKAYNQGLLYACALLGFSLQIILVATFIAPRMNRFNDCYSIGDMMQKKYGQSAKIVTGFLSLMICGGILGAQVGALGAIINVALGIKPIIGIICAFSVLLIYTTLGGMRAVVFTDALQFSFLMIGIPLTFFIGLYQVGGWSHVVQTVPHHYLFFISNAKEAFFFLLLFITFVFGETLIPPYVQRLFMAQSPQDTMKATLASGLVSIPIFLICGALGLVTFTYSQHINADHAFPFIVKTLLPVGLKGIVIAAMLSIILSSASGLLNAASVAFVHDIIKPLSKGKNINFLLMARASTVLVGVIAVIFALGISNALDILLTAYNFWAPIILVPLLAVIFNMRASRRDFFIGASCGVVGAACWKYLWIESAGAGPLVFGILSNLAGFLISRASSKSKDSALEVDNS